MRTRAQENAHCGHARKRNKSRALALNANKKKLRRPVHGVERSIGTGCREGSVAAQDASTAPAYSLLPSGAVVSTSDRSMSLSTVHEARGIAGRVDARWRHRGREQQSKQRPERCLVERRRFEQRPCIDSRSTGAVMDRPTQQPPSLTSSFPFLLALKARARDLVLFRACHTCASSFARVTSLNGLIP